MSEPLYTEADADQLARDIAHVDGSSCFADDSADYELARQLYRSQARSLLTRLTADGWRKLPDGFDGYIDLAISATRSAADDDCEPVRYREWYAGAVNYLEALRGRWAASPSTGEDPDHG